MTELEKQLLSALQQLEQNYSQRENALTHLFEERDTALKMQLTSLQQQVQSLSKQVHELTTAYNQVVNALREA